MLKINTTKYIMIMLGGLLTLASTGLALANSAAEGTQPSSYQCPTLPSNKNYNNNDPIAGPDASWKFLDLGGVGHATTPKNFFVGQKGGSYQR